MPSIDDAIQQKKFKSTQQKVIINLMYSGGWAKSYSTTNLKPFNLTWQQFNLMRILKGQKGKAVPLKVLAERMLDPQSNASRLVDKLVNKNWITRVVCPDDRRQVRLTISRIGAEVLDKATEKLDQANSMIGGDLSIAELNNLSDLLNRFRNQRKQHEI